MSVETYPELQETSVSSLPRQILLRSPEITLKRANRGEFLSALRTNTRHRLQRLGVPWKVLSPRGRVQVEVGTGTLEDFKKVKDALLEIIGVDSIAPAIAIETGRLLEGGSLTRELMEQVILQLAREQFAPERSFAVRARRVDKQFPCGSLEMERWLGDVIRLRSEWKRVDLERPDCTFHVDVYPDTTFLYADRLKGVGGLPVGTAGHVLSLLSGGIDSPVAAFLLARRGCTVDLLHMSAAHAEERDFGGSAMARMAKRLSVFTLRTRLFVVPYVHFDLAMPDRGAGYGAILFRRFLFRAAERLAGQIGAMALVTGDSLAQVASQTLENLITSARAVEAPVLRPLVAHDKQQIMELAREIGTYEISLEPVKDCCALVGRRPKTKSDPDKVSALERRLFPRYQELVEASLTDSLWAEYDCGELVSVPRKLDLHADMTIGLTARRGN